MDVRCDRCQTEYELDDESVSEEGTPVRCTTCGHTFAVYRESLLVEEADGPPTADWMLQSSDGQLHRFRELVTLQRWIVERKVTRDDRLSRTGKTWRSLGEIVELASFFDVVDEVMRARAAEDEAVRTLESQATAARRSPPPREGRRSSGHRPVQGGTLRDSMPSTPVTRSLLLHDDEPTGRGRSDTSELTSVIAGRPLRKVLAMIGLLGAGGVAAYLLFLRGPAAPPPAPIAAPPPASAAPVASAPPAASPMPEPTLAAAPTPGPSVSPSPSLPPPSPLAIPAPTTPPTVAVDPNAVVPAASGYARLVAEGDRLIDSGKTMMAQKAYEKALGLRSDGYEALSGMGYVMLDQRKPSSAVALFKRALGSSPMHAPSLFGLAEAYRDTSETELALENYRKYLLADAGGPDAPAARRQIREIEEAAKAKPAEREPPPPPAVEKAPEEKSPAPTEPRNVDPFTETDKSGGTAPDPTP